MSALIPDVYTKDASGKTFRDHFTAFAELVDDNATKWTVEVFSTNVDDDAISLMIKQGDQQVLIWYEEGSPDQVHVAMDPEGQIADPTNAGETASDEWTGYLTRPVDGDWDGGIDETELGLGVSFVELDDALFWMGNGEDGNGNETFFDFGFHAGVIFNPFYETDLDNHLTGHGILFGRPSEFGAWDQRWWRSNTTKMRVASKTWHEFNGETPSTTAEFLGGRRLTPYLAHDNDENMDVGFCRYICCFGSSEDPMTILPDKDSNQGWLYVNYENASTNQLVVWNKTVNP